MLKKYPLLKNLMLADNDIHYVDEKGKRINRKPDLEKIKQQIRQRRQEKGSSHEYTKNWRS